MTATAPITVLLLAAAAEQAERQASAILEQTPAGLCSVWLLHTTSNAADLPSSGPSGPQLRLPGLSAAAAWNQALALGTSAYVLFLEANQTWRGGSLAALYARVTEAAADLGYVGWQAASGGLLPPDLQQENPQAYWLRHEPWPLAACLFSRTALARVGGLDPAWGDAAGYDLLLRLGAQVRCVRHAETSLELSGPPVAPAAPAGQVERALRLARIRNRCLLQPGYASAEIGRGLREELIHTPLQALAATLQRQQAPREAWAVYRYLIANGDRSTQTLWGGIRAAWSALLCN